MKYSKFYRAIIAVVMMLIGWLPSLANEFEVNGIYYNILSEEVKKAKVTGLSNDYYGGVIIPESVTFNGKSYSVTTIGAEAFVACSDLYSVKIPKSIISIEDAAFVACTNLESIIVESENTKYDSREGCNAIIETASNTLLVGCKSSKIPNSVTIIGENAFNGCTMRSIEIPNSVTIIEGFAFGGCTNLVSIELPNSVKTIGDYAFSYCYGLTNIEIPNSVTSIGDAAFRYCESLTSIEIPNSVTLCGNELFIGCASLESVTIGSGVKSGLYNAFESCYKLSQIISLIPANNLFDTGYDYYFGNFNMDACTLYVPFGAKATYMEKSPWKAFTNIIEIGEPEFDEGATFEYEGITYKVIVKGEELAVIASENGKYSGNVIIPSSVDYNGITYSVTSIGNSAFSNCSEITNVKIPQSVTSIGNSAFWGCTGLTTVIVPHFVLSIGDNAFAYCNGLTTVSIGFRVKSIGAHIFQNCPNLNSVYWLATECEDFTQDYLAPFDDSVTYFYFGDTVEHIPAFLCNGLSNLTSIEIPNSVTSIGGFAFNNCDNLTKITCLATTPPTISSNTFQNFSVCLFVSVGLKTAYQSAEYWSNFSNIVEFDGNFISSRFFIDDFTINAGDTKELIIKFEDGIPFTGFQADLYLPNALAVVKTDDDYTFELINPNSSDHVLAAAKLSNGAIRLLCYSMTNKELSRNENSLVKFRVKASDDLVGEHQISIKDIEFAQKDETKYELKSTTTKFEAFVLAKSITLDKSKVSLKTKETTTLVATVLPSTVSNSSVVWKSSNTSVATVDGNGKVTAVNVGEATITVTTNDGTNLSASCKITVIQLAESVTLDKTSATLKATETLTLKATVTPTTTTNKAVTWKSSNEAVATVDANGKVTAVAVGEATITSTTADGSNKSATCKITVAKTLASSISLDKTSATLKASETLTLKATVAPATTTNKSVTWKSSNEAVATVDANGKVTAVAVGEATITATTADGTNKSATCKITVAKTLAESVTLDKTSATLKATETLTLKATVTPTTTTNKAVTWKSSNEAVATVDANGKVTAVAVGEATITATTKDGSNKSATCKITVAKTLAESVTLDKTSATLKATETLTLKATVTPTTTTNKAVTWKSSNEAVATVDGNGKVTAVAVGEATITATTADGTNKSATCKITVAKTLATSISLDKTSATLKATETLTLKATVTPATTTDKSVTWTSSNTSVATVDTNGKVTAVAVGEATITATTADGSNKSATCKITVAKTLASSISLDKTSATLKASETLTLKATVAPATTTNKTVTWKSSNEAVATVDGNGKVTAVAVGEATITATTTDGSNLSASCKMTIVATPAESITLNVTEVSLKVNGTTILTATVLPETTTNKTVTWKSSNTSIATVNANGMVTAIALGEAIITATTADGSNLSTSCVINVGATPAESISLNVTEASLKVDGTTTLTATVLPETATNKTVTWKSSNTSIATVNANGKVTAVAVGEATITATTADGSNKSATCKITVVKTLAESVTLDKTAATLKASEILSLKATVAPATATNKSVTWTSSNEAVATVDANGIVTAIAVGEAVITATTTDGSDLSASCQVTVVPTIAETIILDKTEISLEATETATLVATVLPELTTNKSVTWTSSNEAVATVDANGVVTAIALGEAVITATTTDGSNLLVTCKVTVVPTLAETITLDKTEISIEATETATLVATVLPELTTNKSVTWKSSNEAVATVDANGVVTAIALGEAVITATTTDGSNLSEFCKVTVVPTLATSIELDKTEISLEATETATLVATVLPELTTKKSVEWTSSNEAVATVDANGVVTAIAVGEATITATTTDGTNLSATCKVTVVPTIAETITLDKTEISLEATETATLVATVLPELTTNKSVTWTSSNKAVATVDANGVVTAIAVGEATITATTTDGSNLSDTCKVTVVATLAETITLDKTEISIEATETATLVATVLPETTSNKSVEWKSSNDAVATVNNNGEVTAIAVGEAIITAITTDGTNLSASCQVTVVPTLVVSIEVTPNSVEAEENSEVQLSVNILPENATYKSVEWSSSNDAIASVNANGLVKIYKEGNVVITATTTDGTNLSATCSINVYSGIDGVNGNEVIVATIGDNIVVKNAKLGSVVNVYSSNGALIKSMTATDGSVVIEAPIKGIYVITIDGKSFKVMVK